MSAVMHIGGLVFRQSFAGERTDMRTAQLSPVMRDALHMAETHGGGKLVRLPGGFWTYPDCERRGHDGVPVWNVGTNTVQALVTRNAMTYSEWKEGRRGRFPIAASINTT